MKKAFIYSQLYLLVCISSCTGQQTIPFQADVQSDQNVAIGDSVSEMRDSPMIIFQDSKGNYWFAGKGVYKYDGANFVHFRTDHGLCAEGVWGIQEDKVGNLYFETQSGISKFDGMKFSTLRPLAKDSSQNQWKLEPNDLWFRGNWNENGVYRYDGTSLYHLEFPESERAQEFFKTYPNVPYSPYGIYSMYTDKSGAIWFGTASLGACRFDGTSIAWLYEDHLTNTPAGGSFGIRSIIEDKTGDFWFCNTRYRFEIQSKVTEKNGFTQINYRRRIGVPPQMMPMDNESPYFMSVVEDDAGILWMATYEQGIWKYDGQGMVYYSVKDGDKRVTVYSIYKDHQGNIWLGTHDAGPFKFNGTRFEKFKA